jgi:hypothetical protein
MVRAGQINKAIRDFSFNPSQPLQSVSKYASNLISRTFLNDFANEVQEFSAARAAKVVADEIRSGTLPAADVPLVENTLRAMGFTKEQAKSAVTGNAPDVINQFETKAAEFLSSGNQILAEKSRLGSSRGFNQLFWFQSYPMLKFRQGRSVLNNIIEDAHGKDWDGVYNNAKLLGRFVGGTALSGAITAGLIATIREGLYGAGIRKQEAQDDFGRFVMNSFLMGMGGPLMAWQKIAEETGSFGQLVENVPKYAFESFAPYSIGNNLARSATGYGEYEGLDPFEKIGKFLENKTPGLKPFKAGMAAAGLVQDNPKLDAAISAYYRWSHREIGIDKTEIRRFNDDRKEVRGFARRVVNAIRDGEDFNEPLVKSIIAAAGTRTDNPYDSASRSIRGKQIIGVKMADGKLIGKLSIEELTALRKHIGDDPVNRIMAYDAMLDAVADLIAGMNK